MVGRGGDQHNLENDRQSRFNREQKKEDLILLKRGDNKSIGGGNFYAQSTMKFCFFFSQYNFAEYIFAPYNFAQYNAISMVVFWSTRAVPCFCTKRKSWKLAGFYGIASSKTQLKVNCNSCISPEKQYKISKSKNVWREHFMCLIDLKTFLLWK